ncbi:MAG: hypothetical protein FAF04_07990 [Epsilonproteobacteria bacterium]|nr:hypothetical protein [Campylobacterota bacterium]
MNHAKNFALVTPVRGVETEYDKIIFHTNITAQQKLVALTTLLIQESLEKKKEPVTKIANAMASKAMHMLFGDPKVSRGRLYAVTNEFSRTIRSKKRTKVSVATFRVRNEKLHLVSLQ